MLRYDKAGCTLLSLASDALKWVRSHSTLPKTSSVAEKKGGLTKVARQLSANPKITQNEDCIIRPVTPCFQPVETYQKVAEASRVAFSEALKELEEKFPEDNNGHFKFGVLLAHPGQNFTVWTPSHSLGNARK